jgi:hypothetical protein
MRPILVILFFLLVTIAEKSQAQRWLPGHFTDTSGKTTVGLLRIDPPGKGLKKDEGFIEFKADKKAKPIKVTASDLKSFVVRKDSFVVAHAPKNETWPKKELDFVAVALDEDIKVYAGFGGGSGRGSGFSIGIGLGGGFGIPIGRNFGLGVGAGTYVPLYGEGSGYEGIAWYYGENTAKMYRLTDENFEDTMSNIMGDYPEVVEKIHKKEYFLGNISRLIAYYKQVEAAANTK